MGGSGQRPSFGVARPMKSGPSVGGGGGSGDQFPPMEEEAEAATVADTPSPFPAAPGAAMDRLNQRQNAEMENGNSKQEGFEASVHRIKEQVLPRLLERVDPEAAATLGKGDAKAAEQAIANLEKADPTSEDLPQFKEKLAALKK